MHDDSSATALAEVLRHEIQPLPPGARLPSNRRLVAQHGVSATTVSAALALLARRRLIETRPGVGAFKARPTAPLRPRDTAWQADALTPDTTRRGASSTDEVNSGAMRTFEAAALRGNLTPGPPDVIDLNSGYPHPALQPLDLLRRAFTRASRHPGAWARPPVAGLTELRSWFAADIGGDLGREDVIVSPGGQAALATIMRALTQPGDRIVVESPTYPGILAAAGVAGAQVVGVPLDDQGLDAERLDIALGRSGARLVVTQPLFHNPTGLSMTKERRQQILDIARSHDAFVIEDDFARHLGHADGGPLPAPMVVDDTAGTVIHIRSLTKATSPNVRVAGVVSRGTVSTRLRDAFTIDTMIVPAPLQRVALEVVTGPGWRRARTTLRDELSRRRVDVAAAVEHTLGAQALALEPRGGYHLWVRLPDVTDVGQFTAAAAHARVALTPGTNYEVTPGAPPHVRISYVGAPSSADVVEGVRRLGDLVQRCEA